MSRPRRLLTAPIFWTALSRPLSKDYISENASPVFEVETLYFQIFQLCLRLSGVCEWENKVKRQDAHEARKNLHEEVGDSVQSVLRTLDDRQSFVFLQACDQVTCVVSATSLTRALLVRSTFLLRS